ncbi:DUF2974 domain-containing protein [uncultured Bifidobacterium sp.]|uniref:DUF2974 domain-containing protein n=1 Tax=uncultured Bifidobacterium sp. TaxID=165187 RepID=UPI0028DC28C7|nr:DUF2974 domain-containing protein [uncultured Bifidobacterium sp.]
MGTVIDYVTSTTEGFDSRPFGEVDALVLSCLAYESPDPRTPRLADQEPRLSNPWRRLRGWRADHPLASLSHVFHAPFDGPTLADVGVWATNGDFDPVAAHTGLGDAAGSVELLRATASSPRFAPIRVGAVDEILSVEDETQFAAETFRLPDGTLVVAYRGTDDSFVGWRENFAMTFQYPVPAQREAADYLRRVAGIWGGRILVVGHSKGGNLATYAAMTAPRAVRLRIGRAYSLDGPGFPQEVVNGDDYRGFMERMDKIIPDSSIIGMIFDTPEPCTVVSSTQKGLMQHDALSWRVRNGRFARVPEVAPSSQYFNRRLNEWLAGLSLDQRRRTVDALFVILQPRGSDNLSAVRGSLPRVIPEMIASFAGLSAEDRRNLLTATNILVRAAWARNTPRRRRP